MVVVVVDAENAVELIFFSSFFLFPSFSDDIYMQCCAATVL